MFNILKNLFKSPVPSEIITYKTYPDDIIIKKAKALIEQSSTAKQLKTAKKYLDLIKLNDIDETHKIHIKEELSQLWLEKEKIISQNL